MKNFTILLLFVGVFFYSTAQVNSDTIDMKASYTNDVYYSLEDGFVSEYTGAEWTVAFYNSAMSAAIMINEGRGVELYIASEDINDFATIDTTGNISTWTQLHDSEFIWDAESAFEDEPVPGSGNYGWGEYNFANHQISASRVFVIKTIAGEYLKVLVEDKVSGVFNYRYASLDNTFDTTIVINTPDLVGKNYAYLNMDNHTILDRDPVKTEWDLLFTKYWDLYDSGFGAPAYASVTGVVINDNVGVAKVSGVAVADAAYTNQAFDTVKNVIGHDFKFVDFSANPPALAVKDSLSYFIKSNDGDIFHFYFTRSDGISTGIVGFNVEKISSATTSISNSEVISIETIYPNPSIGSAQLIFSSEKATTAELSIFNLLGEMVYYAPIQTSNGLNTFPINLQKENNGVYLIQLKEGNKISTQKLILNK